MGYKQEPGNPGEGRGQRGNHDERIEPGLKVDDDQQVDEHDREGQSAQKANVGGLHGLNLSANNDSRTARQLLTGSVKDLVDIAGHATEIAPGDSAKDVNHRRDVVIGDHSHSHSPLGRYETRHDRWRRGRVGAGDGDVL